MLQLFLAASALIWGSLGVWSFVDPAFLADVAGVSPQSTTGLIELRAMYGGLPVSLGVLAGAALIQPSLQRPALIALAFVCAGLFVARLLGAVVSAEFSSYTAIGLLYELVSSAFATRLIAGRPGHEPD